MTPATCSGTLYPSYPTACPHVSGQERGLPMKDLQRTYLELLHVARRLIASPEVEARWDQPSALQEAGGRLRVFLDPLGDPGVQISQQLLHRGVAVLAFPHHPTFIQCPGHGLGVIGATEFDPAVAHDPARQVRVCRREGGLRRGPRW